MTRDEIVAQLAAIERALADRVVITRVIVDTDGRVIKRICRTVFLRQQEEK